MDATGTQRRCGPGIRGVAMAIDSFAWLALFMLTALAVGYVTGDLQTTSEGVEANLRGTPALVSLLLWLGLSIGYHTVFEWRWGKTVGKYLVSIQAVSDDGTRLSLRAAFVRNLLRLVDWLPAFYLLGIGTLVASGENKRLGDRVGNTLVVRK